MKQSAINIYRKALEEIVDPIKFMRERADSEGKVLTGYAAILANDVSYLKNIARKALDNAESNRRQRKYITGITGQ